MEFFDAIRIFSQYQISGAPVVDKDGKLVGIMSEVDCLRGILDKTYHEEEVGGKVSELMTTDVDTVDASIDSIAVAYQFINCGRRRIPILDKGVLVSQLSRKNILRAVNNFICSNHKK